MKFALILILIHGALSQCSNPEYCLSCVNKQCTQCAASYLNLITSVCVAPTKTVSYCQTYIADGNCGKCMPGYYLDLAGNCMKNLDANCGLYNLVLGCLACTNGIKHVRGSCSGSAKCATANCMMCDQTDSCGLCNPGYTLNEKNACIANSVQIANCYQSANNTCTECIYGFYMNGTNCVMSTKYKNAGVLGVVVTLLMSLIF